MSTKHTPGPWFSDDRGNVWRRRPEDLYENGGSVAGDKPIAVAIKGWHEEREKGFPVEFNARLIAAAPELLEALQALEALFSPAASDSTAATWIDKARAAIAKATGEQA